MKFLADMGISPLTIAFLRSIGQDAAHLHEQGLDRLPDSDILAKARVEGAVLLAHDQDFSELVAASGARLPSIIMFRLRSMRPDGVNRRLHAVILNHRPALEQGAIISVGDDGIRVRMLPIKSGT